MSNYEDRRECVVSVPRIVNDDVTFYIVVVQVDAVCWEVSRRYSDFAALHEKLIEEGVDRDVLPPKKLLGNKDPAFLMKRRKELESYLQGIFHFLARNLPVPLAEFLDFNKYDLNFILRNLASDFYQREADLTSLQLDQVDDGREGVAGKEEGVPLETSWTPLEMYSVSQRLQHTQPPSDPQSKRYDFTNVMDACCRLEQLKLTGGDQKIGSSNIILNDLTFDFLAFKALTKLRLHQIKLDSGHLTSLGILRSTLTELTVHDSGVLHVHHVLLCDASLTDLNLASKAFVWNSLTLLDLSSNKLEGLDRSIRLAPGLQTLILTNNSINNLDQLTGLPRLRHLSLSNNKISIDQDLHVKLGCVTHIDLSHNKISSLQHFIKLYSLQELNISHNKVKELEEVYTVCKLPCLENLDLSNNKVNQQVDYRLKILEAFGTRSREVKLDGERATKSELDKVSVLMALRVTREKKSPTSLFGNLPNSEQWRN